MRTAVDAGVRHVVHMSSLAAYAPAPVGRAVAEDWPVTGIPSSQYSRDKSAAEHVVREVVGRHGEITLTVVRPTLVLQPEAASEIGRYFLGPLGFGAARLIPRALARRLPLPAPALSVGFVHADDVADAIVRMLDQRVAGPFNLSAEPLLDAAGLARALGSRRLPVPAALVRTALSAAFHARLVPTEPGWLDVGLQAPALDSARARSVLGWEPAHRGDDAVRRFVAALGRGEGATGPLLAPEGGRARPPAGQRSVAPGPTD
jgi:nucleoside-diphosphate-sugar epimerase